MGSEIKKLQPNALWESFYAITQIPHPSKHEDKIRQFFVDFGKNLGLETIVDSIGNVVIRKPATPGMENRKGVVLQGHMDMVPQKNSDKNHNFETDSIETIIGEDGWVRANGTTLGADNGIGVAAGMAVLMAKDLVHGPIEVLITTDEETGMTGAFGLDGTILKGDILLNLDSEDYGELYVGCAGGLDANVSMKYSTETTPANMEAYKIIVSGLKGGHSGMDIILGRGNANKIIVRLLTEIQKIMDIRLANIEGGSLRNAIPREAFATIVAPKGSSEALKQEVIGLYDVISSELSATEPDMKFKVEPAEMPKNVINADASNSFVKAIYACPNGVIRMSNDMPGLVETSSNLAIINSANGTFVANSLMRSSVDSAKDDLANAMKAVFDLAGADIEFSGAYPGWKPNPDSAILKTMLNIFKDMTGKTPDIKAIHAGLECGILGSKYPKWDMISFGPTIRFPHSPDEKVNVESVQKFWEFLVATLKNIPA